MDATQLFGPGSGPPMYNPNVQFQHQPQVGAMSGPPQPMQNPPRKVQNMDDLFSASLENQQTTAAAMTLPSRDIPMERLPTLMDPGVQQNYVTGDETMLTDGPTPVENRRGQFIDDMDELDSTRMSADFGHDGSGKRSVNLEDTYNSIQVPIFLAILFFVFQLPMLKQYEYQYVPYIFNADMTWSVAGYALNSLLFAAVYFVLARVLAF